MTEWRGASTELKPRNLVTDCAVLIFFLFALTLSSPVLANPAAMPNAAPDAGEQPITGPLDFAGSVGVALRQAPAICTSAIEIDLKKIDENDAKFSVLPTVSLRTFYYINTPPPVPGSSTDPYSLSFVAEPYSPIESYYTIKARQMITRLAVLAHLKVISDYLSRLAEAYLEIDALDRMAAYQDSVVELAVKAVAYTSSRMETGGASSLELRLATEEESLARTNAQRIRDSRSAAQDSVKRLLGMDPNQKIEVNAANAPGQALRGTVRTFADIPENHVDPIDRAIQEMKEELQKLSVKMAYARFFPRLVFRAESGDPLYRTNSNEYFVAIGLEMPLWDGFKRNRDITRQKVILKRVELEGEARAGEFSGKWQASREKYKRAEADLIAAQRQAEIASIRERQGEIAYNSGRQPYSAYLIEKRARIEAGINVINKNLEKEKALLDVQRLSGDLLGRYVDAKNF